MKSLKDAGLGMQDYNCCPSAGFLASFWLIFLFLIFFHSFIPSEVCGQLVLNCFFGNILLILIMDDQMSKLIGWIKVFLFQL